MRFRQALAKQLLFWILLCSSALTLLTTAFQLLLDYQYEISAIDERLVQIEQSYLTSLAGSVWVEDERQIQLQLEGIKNLPDVSIVQLIHGEHGEEDHQLGNHFPQYHRDRRWSIDYQFENATYYLGDLYVVTNLSAVYDRLADRIMVILISQATKTFLISFIIFFIVYALIGRHLQFLTDAISSLNLTAQKPKSLTLNRKHREDEIQHLVNSFNDLCHKVYESAQELNEQRDQAEQANKMKDQFLANISHEVRTPMNGIMGMSQLLQQTSLNTKQMDYLDRLQLCSQHLLELLNRILEISKLESESVELNPQIIDLKKIGGECTFLARPIAEEKGITLKYHFHNEVNDPDSLLLIADEVRIKQIFNNLLNNAIKFTEKGEVIFSIHCQPQAKSSQRKNTSSDQASILVSITDTGIGIPHDKQKAIFEKFNQADNSNTRKYGGSGLGLTICAKLLECMGSHLNLSSTEGKGSQFYFYLTLGIADMTALNITTPSESLSGYHVLIVDDQVFNSRMLAEQMQQWGLDVIECNQPNNACELVKLHDDQHSGFDFIFLDKNMPGLDGFSVFESINKLPLNKLPAAFLTSAYLEEKDKHRCEELGFKGYLSIPSHETKIKQLMTEALNNPLTSNLTSTLNQTRNTPPNRQLETQIPPGLRILLVEDCKVNQKVCALTLEKIKANIEIAEDGLKAIEACSIYAFDLILMDCHLPEVNGFEATRAIRQLKDNPNTHIPIIAFTANHTEENRRRCFESGMNAILIKPHPPSDLYSVIARHTHGRSKPDAVRQTKS